MCEDRRHGLATNPGYLDRTLAPLQLLLPSWRPTLIASRTLVRLANRIRGNDLLSLNLCACGNWIDLSSLNHCLRRCRTKTHVKVVVHMLTEMHSAHALAHPVAATTSVPAALVGTTTATAPVTGLDVRIASAEIVRQPTATHAATQTITTAVELRHHRATQRSAPTTKSKCSPTSRSPLSRTAACMSATSPTMSSGITSRTSCARVSVQHTFTALQAH
jgi:hypothetical protein